MTSPRCFLFAFLAVALGACASSNGSSDDDDACSPTHVVDDAELVSTSQSLSANEQRAVNERVDALLGRPELAGEARHWSEAVQSSERALVRDFVETALLDADFEPTNAAARYTALRRLLVAGDLVLTRSEGEREGSTRPLYDLFRVSGGRIVERWSAERAIVPAGSGGDRSF